jgi:lysozyme
VIPAALRARLAGTATVGLMALTVALVGYYEGRENVPYLDPVQIATVCVGHTGNVDMDRIYTDEECDELLAGDLGVAFRAVEAGVKVPIGPSTRAALASFTFNVGAAAFYKSTLLRRMNSGEGPPACDELLRWVYAKGEELPGLVNRRRTERELCIAGFSEIAP